MKNIGIIILSFLIIGCSNQEGEAPCYGSTSPESGTQNGTDKFILEFDLQEIGLNTFNLSAIIDPGEGNYVISPFSSDDFYLHFDLVVDDNEAILVDGMTSEYPQSTEEFDNIIDQKVRLVKQKTTYLKHIEVNSTSDFEVQGIARFLLEPICIPYNVEFAIQQEDGVLSVHKTSTSIDPSYKKVN